VVKRQRWRFRRNVHHLPVHPLHHPPDRLQLYASIGIGHRNLRRHVEPSQSPLPRLELDERLGGSDGISASPGARAAFGPPAGGRAVLRALDRPPAWAVRREREGPSGASQEGSLEWKFSKGTTRRAGVSVVSTRAVWRVVHRAVANTHTTQPSASCAGSGRCRAARASESRCGPCVRGEHGRVWTPPNWSGPQR
jgi:hypothetical protein